MRFTILILTFGIAAFALLAQACVMIAMAIGGAKAQKKIMGKIDEIKEKLLPVLDKSNVLIADLSPQISLIAGHAKAIAGNVEDVSALVKEKLNEFGPTISDANQAMREANATVREANRKTQSQVTRVDEMVSSVLDATAQAGRSIESGIKTPVREISGILEGVKAGVMAFISGNRR